MAELDLDLTVDMVPPKDPYIQVKVVLDDIGEVLLGDQSATLVRHSVHSLRRTDAEPFISQDAQGFSNFVYIAKRGELHIGKLVKSFEEPVFNTSDESIPTNGRHTNNDRSRRLHSTANCRGLDRWIRKLGLRV
ncbi:hypothetical protein QJS10_CPA07g00090 [Acorus calamus]|uniref:DNA replication complex GINS protein PSF1 C-terminal domain-containing protein n=1 Tax=Acorus calamus TaxID=4465 RepID=A0AAV9EFL6_ACOCL|nr:hypothetical protein QJS10_CPA07g00090 [Acorus calamus]